MSFVKSTEAVSGLVPPIRVMIVDDSLLTRGFLARILESDVAFRVVAAAENGQVALDILRHTPVDVVILDIEMPIMDGLTAVPKLKGIDPAVQIVMASVVSQRNAEISMKALSLGAIDYLPKPAHQDTGSTEEFERSLKLKVKELGRVAWRKGVRANPTSQVKTGARARPDISLRPWSTERPDVVALGSSTGGPHALEEVIKVMGGGLSHPVVITQHMPASFTTQLAHHLSKKCRVVCVEAKNGDVLFPGVYYLAPGDFHMLVVKQPAGATIRLTKDAPENFCRPAIDPMLMSLVATYGSRVLAVILTGMGRDGLIGCRAIVEAGGAVIVQDEETSVVWGMPGSVAEAGLSSAVTPLGGIGTLIRHVATGSDL